jgi:hypothetical protein
VEYFHIINEASGMALDGGDRINMWHPLMEPSQLWRLTPYGYLENAKSNQVLEIVDDDSEEFVTGNDLLPDSVSMLQLHSYRTIGVNSEDQDAIQKQKWIFTDDGYILNRLNSKVLDVSTIILGAGVHAAAQNRMGAQKWKFTKPNWLEQT